MGFIKGQSVGVGFDNGGGRAAVGVSGGPDLQPHPAADGPRMMMGMAC